MNPLRRNLRASVGDGAFYSLMVGMGETYLPAYALALQAGGIATGLLAAVPMSIGATIQLASPALIRRVNSHRRWVACCAGLQAVCLLAMPLAIWSGKWGIALVYVAASFYWATGQATAPAWNAWIEMLVPSDVRTHFFARRSRVSQTCVLLGFVAGGLFLEYGESQAFPLLAFAIVLMLAGSSRFVSAICLACHSEAPLESPTAKTAADDYVGLREMIRKIRGHEGAQLCLFLFAVQVSVQIAGPYFAPFMLAKMKLSYLQYMMLIACGFAGKVVSLPAWGRLAHRAGARALMWIGSASIAPLAAMWLMIVWLENPIPYLAVIQVVGGVAWAAYELAFFLLFFETIPRRERVSVLTLYNFGYASATVIGALVGGAWLALLGESRNSYLGLFCLSSFSRVASLVLLARLPQMDIKVVVPALRVLSLRPSDGELVDAPVLPAIPVSSDDSRANDANARS